MAIVKNEFGEDRVCPTLGYYLVPDGETAIVPDDEVEHWKAGGWTLVDPSPAVAPAKSKNKAPEEAGQ